MKRASSPITRCLLLVATLAASACAADAGGDEGDKSDEGPTDTPDCKSEEALIASSRDALRNGPDRDFFKDVEFFDGVDAVTPIEDLNGDGVEDLIVNPGLSFAGSNTQATVFLSSADKAGCPVFAGDLGGASDVHVAEGRAATNGVLDLIAVNISACEALFLRFNFDGKNYIAGESTTERVCEPEPEQ